MSVRKLFPIAVLSLAGVVLWALVIAPRLDTPERQVARYLTATSSGNEQDALDAWPTFAGGAHPRQALLVRRIELTRELTALRVGASYQVRSIEWWRTCCEPGPIQDSGNAGLARMHVSATDPAGHEHQLVFEVFVKNIKTGGAKPAASTSRSGSCMRSTGVRDVCLPEHRLRVLQLARASVGAPPGEAPRRLDVSPRPRVPAPEDARR